MALAVGFFSDVVCGGLSCVFCRGFCGFVCFLRGISLVKLW